MSEISPRPIGTQYTTVSETDSERVITTWKIVGHSGGLEIAQKVDETRTPKTLLGGREKK